MSTITDYKNDGEEPGVLYAMFEEDERLLKLFYPSVHLIELAMGRDAKDLIKGVENYRGFNKPSSVQRLVKIKIESVEYMK